MRKNTKLVDALFDRAIAYFPAFRLPVVWDKMTGYNMAEWQNGYIENFGELHYIKLNFKKHTDEADLFDTICHELIHAWQYENNLPVDHGLEFCEWVIKFSAFGINAASPDCITTDLKKAKKLVERKAKNYFK